jgi:hypothetical protein
MTQLNECGDFTHSATLRFHKFAQEHGMLWESWKKHFWIRRRDRTEMLQGNYVTDGIRGLMHGLGPNELSQLSSPVVYRSHPCGQLGHRFYIKDDEAIAVVTQIILSKLKSAQ